MREATVNDLDRIRDIYRGIIIAERESGQRLTRWEEGEYPTADTALNAINVGEMFVLENDFNAIVGSVVLHKRQLEEFASVDWMVDVNEDDVIMVSTVAIAVEYKNQGYGAKLVQEIKRYAKDMGCRVIRLETSETNKPAQRLYEKVGFSYLETIDLTLEGTTYKDNRCYQCLLN